MLPPPPNPLCAQCSLELPPGSRVLLNSIPHCSSCAAAIHIDRLTKLRRATLIVSPDLSTISDHTNLFTFPVFATHLAQFNLTPHKTTLLYFFTSPLHLWRAKIHPSLTPTPEGYLNVPAILLRYLKIPAAAVRRPIPGYPDPGISARTQKPAISPTTPWSPSPGSLPPDRSLPGPLTPPPVEPPHPPPPDPR